MSRKTRVSGWREERDREIEPSGMTTSAGEGQGDEVATKEAAALATTAGSLPAAGSDDPLNWSGQLPTS